ncbi:MAG TPA: hypothetical protein VFQ22_13985 [Longimicrobiales bacterium]|nr:hypothetical protein [Longimicrobiales bacterium]
MTRLFGPFRACALLAGTLLAASATGAAAQGASVAREENFRSEPNGTVLGRLRPGTALGVVGREGNWLEVEVEGWVWLRSLQAREGELELVVSADGGENVRSAPSGTILGRFEEGVLLDELGRDPGWANVRRRGWIWSASVRESAAAAPSEPAPPSGTAAAPAPAAVAPEGFTTVGGAGTAILAAPDGDTLALASPATDLQLVSRDGSWARVRLEGWIWLPAADTAVSEPAAIEPDDLEESPDAYVGRVVAWELQFISLERAEEVRTDFRRGEPFLLTRYGGPEGPYVYVAVPPERLAEVQGLVPLERISVTARVRTASSELTGAPIIDLLSIETAG